MPLSSPPISDPEIISPAAQIRLDKLGRKHEAEAMQLERLEALAKLMDAKFNVPLLPVPIGLDSIIGLIPGIGDTISLGVSGVIMVGAHRIDVPKHHLTLMCGNMFVDWAIGLIPVVGDLFDIGWQGNMRNVRIARAHLEERWAEERADALGD